MCLAVPGKILEIRDERGTRMAIIDFDGVRKEICLAYLPDIEVGDYAIVHVGLRDRADRRSLGARDPGDVRGARSCSRGVGRRPVAAEPARVDA